MSAVERNLRAAASSRKPIAPLSVVSHAPLFGSRANSPGNKDSNTNGSANAVLKTNIPMIGFTNAAAPVAFAARTNRLPTIGAVQVNADTTKVKPMPRMPSVEPFLDALSCWIFEGRRISVTSRRARPKTINRPVKTKLTQGLMAKSRAAVPPDNTESTTPRPVKHVTIPKA